MIRIMTGSQYKELQRKRKEVQDKLPKAREDYARAASNGDMRENDEASAASQRISDLNKQLQSYEEILGAARIYPESKQDSTIVEFGSYVVFMLDSEQFSCEMSDAGIDYMNTISVYSPLGQAVMHKSVGDSFPYVDAEGQRHTIQILEVV